MQLDGVRGYRGHAPSVQDRGAARQHQRVGPERLQLLGDRVGVVGEQAQRDRLRAAPGQQRQQVQCGRVVGGEPVERHRPGRRHRMRVSPSRVVIQYVLSALRQQP